MASKLPETRYLNWQPAYMPTPNNYGWENGPFSQQVSTSYVPPGPPGDKMTHPNAVLFPYFGFNQKALEKPAEWSQDREYLLLPEAFKGSNPMISMLIMDQVLESDMWPIRAALPLFKWEGGLTIKWEILRFNEHILNRTPELAPSRLVTQKRDEKSDTIVRYGLAFMLEHGFYRTPQGKINYAANLQQIANATIRTLCLGAQEQILHVDHTQWTNGSVGRLNSMQDFRDLVMKEKRTVAITQKLADGRGFVVAWDELAQAFKRITGEMPTMCIVGPGVAKYCANIPGYNPPLANQTVKQQMALKGVSVFEFYSVPVSSNVPNVNPADIGIFLGGCFQLDMRFLHGVPPNEFQTDFLDRYIHNEDTNDYSLMRYRELIKKLGLFRQTADKQHWVLTELGQRFFDGCVNWKEWVESNGILKKWVASFRSRRNDIQEEFASKYRPKRSDNRDALNRLVGLLTGDQAGWQTFKEKFIDAARGRLVQQSGIGGSQSYPQQQQQQQGQSERTARENAAAAAENEQTLQRLRQGRPQQQTAEDLLREEEPDDKQSGGYDLRFTYQEAVAARDRAAEQESPKPVQYTFWSIVVDAWSLTARESKYVLMRRGEERALKQMEETPSETNQKSAANFAGTVIGRMYGDGEQGPDKQPVPIFGMAGAGNGQPVFAYIPTDEKLILGVATSGPVSAMGELMTRLIMQQTPDLTTVTYDVIRAIPLHPAQAAYSKLLADLLAILRSPQVYRERVQLQQVIMDARAAEASRTALVVNVTLAGRRSNPFSSLPPGPSASQVHPPAAAPASSGRLEILERQRLQVRTLQPLPRAVANSLPVLMELCPDELLALYSRRVVGDQQEEEKDDTFPGTQEFIRAMRLLTDAYTMILKDNLSPAETKKMKKRDITQTAERNQRLAQTGLRLAMREMYEGRLIEFKEFLPLGEKQKDRSETVARVKIDMLRFVALVNDIGADAMEKIRPKITVGALAQFRSLRHRSNEEKEQDQKDEDSPEPSEMSEADVVQMLEYVDIQDADIVFFGLENDLFPMFLIHGFQPAKHYSATPMVAMSPGAGRTLHGHHSFMLGDDPNYGVHFGHWTAYMRSVVEDDRKVQHRYHVHVSAYHSGGGSSVMDPENPEHRRQWEEGNYPASIFAVPVRHDDHAAEESRMFSITGRFHRDLGQSYNDDPVPTFMPEVARIWGFQQPANPLVTAPYTQPNVAYQTLCFQSHQLACQYLGDGRFNPRGNVVLDDGHFGQDWGYPGCGNIMNGSKMWLERPDFSPLSSRANVLSSGMSV